MLVKVFYDIGNDNNVMMSSDININ